MKTAVILSSGKGSKLWPYNATKVKSVVSVANKPLIIWTLLSLIHLGINKVVIVTSALGKNQISYAIEKFLIRKELQTFEVEFIIEEIPNGTNDSLKKAFSLVNCNDLLIIYGDTVTSTKNIEKLLYEHSKGVHPACVLVDRLVKPPYINERSHDWICVNIKDTFVKEITGHPRSAFSHRFCGIFTLNESVFKYFDSHPGFFSSIEVGMMPPLENEAAQNIQSIFESGKYVKAVESEDFFVDVDKSWHILEANYALLEYQSQLLTEDVVPKSAEVSSHAEIRGKVVLGENSRIGPKAIIKGNLWLGENSLVDNGAILNPVVNIGNGSEVANYCFIGSHTSVGDRCFIDHAAEIEGILMDNVYAVHYMEFSGIAGHSTDLGAATVCGTLRFDDMNTSHKIKGRYEVPRNFANSVFIGDFCRTGVNAILMPGVKIGPYSIVGPGVILKEDLPEKTIVSVEQQLTKKVWGPEKYGW